MNNEIKIYPKITKAYQTKIKPSRSGPNIRFCVQEKIDGSNLSIVKDRDGNMHFFSRNKKINYEDNAFPDLKKYFDKHLLTFKAHMLPQDIVSGEWLASGKIKYPIEKLEDRFVIFDFGRMYDWYYDQIFTDPETKADSKGIKVSSWSYEALLWFRKVAKVSREVIMTFTVKTDDNGIISSLMLITHTNEEPWIEFGTPKFSEYAKDIFWGKRELFPDSPMEGLVFKNYMDEPIVFKLVFDSYHEIKKTPRISTTSDADTILVDKLINERMNKFVQYLSEVFGGSDAISAARLDSKLIPMLLKKSVWIYNDIMEEEKDIPEHIIKARLIQKRTNATLLKMIK